MRVAVSQVWYGLQGTEKDVYGPYRYCLHHCYAELLDRKGLQPLAVVPVKNTSPDDVLEGFDMLVLTGGGDPDPSIFNRENMGSRNPEMGRPLWDIELYRAARRKDIPVLGICLGMQLAGIAHGAALIQDLKTTVSHDGTSANRLSHHVTVDPGSILYRFLGDRPSVSSWHHQALESVPEGFRVSARTDDGVIEAMESNDHRVLGLQWHPERDSTGPAVMEAMITMAGKR